jgi:hypothetical protein
MNFLKKITHNFFYKFLIIYFNKITKKFLIIYFNRAIKKKNNYYSQVLNNKIISSKSFIFISDIYSLDLRSSSKIYFIPNKDLSTARIFYVCSDSLEDFYQNYIHLIKKDFIIITGDSDRIISEDIEVVKKIIKNNNFKIWFSQNLLKENKFLKRIPIGLDFISGFHDTHIMNFHQKKKFVEPNLHEKLMINIINNSMDISKRQDLIYCNYHFTLERGDRKDCYYNTDKNLCYFLPNRVDFLENYKLQTKFKFVMSPSGAGLDCHRTWESLVLGNIPIVKSSPIDDIYEGLPVLIVKSWSDINLQLLENFYNAYKTNDYNYEKLTFFYWKNKVYSESNENLHIKKYYLFKEYLNTTFDDFL